MFLSVITHNINHNVLINIYKLQPVEKLSRSNEAVNTQRLHVMHHICITLQPTLQNLEKYCSVWNSDHQGEKQKEKKKPRHLKLDLSNL